MPFRSKGLREHWSWVLLQGTTARFPCASALMADSKLSRFRPNAATDSGSSQKCRTGRCTSRKLPPRDRCSLIDPVQDIETLREGTMKNLICCFLIGLAAMAEAYAQ